MAPAVLLVCGVGSAGGQRTLGDALAQQNAVPTLAVLAAEQPAAPPVSVELALRQLAASAAVIFTGSVASVREAAGGVQVEFDVEQGLHGVASGGTYRMRVSPWAGGTERFHTGQRALFLLHAPSAAGYSSPVGGERGIVPLSGDALAGMLDLRWIATEVLRSPGSITAQRAAAATRGTASRGGDAAAIPFTGTGTVAGADAQSLARASNVTGEDVHAVDRDMVTSMLRTWDAAAAGQGR